MSSKKNEITEDFKRKLTSFLPELSQNNHYIAFLHDRITCELQIQLKGILDHDVMTTKNEERPNWVNHPFPLSAKKIQFLPMFTDANDPVYKTDMDELLNWASRSRDPVIFFEMTKDYYSQKKSWVVQKILSLSEDFIKKLNEISHKTGIPLLSLHNMYVLMTGVNDFFQSEQKEVLLRPFLQYPVPVSVSPDQRDDLIIGVWKRIYNLLVECYWVLAVEGMVDLLNVIGNYKEEGLEQARNYLMHSVVYSELESRVLLLKNAQDLSSYVLGELALFERFLPDFCNFVNEATKPIVKKREKLLDYPISPLTNGIPRRKQKEFFREPESDGSLNVFDEKSENLTFGDELLSSNGDLADFSEAETKDNEQNQHGHFKEIPVLSEVTVIDGVEKKMESGLLKTYRLQGDPDKMAHLLFKIIYNISRTITDEIYSQKLQERYGISSSTWRRWMRLIKEGKIDLPDHPDRPSGVRSINDLFEVEIQKISKDNENRRSRRGEDYFTQNEMIKALQGDKLRSALRNRYGIVLRKYGRTSLRDMLNRLIKENRIPVEKREGAHRFKKSDSLHIVREIAKLSSK